VMSQKGRTRMAKAVRKRKRYTAAQRTEVLTAATRDGLTAAQVEKKFGVAPVTYYSWRKKSGVAGRRGRRRATPVAARSAASAVSAKLVDLSTHVRQEVGQRVRQILPDIVRSEVSDYLNTLFSGKKGAGRRRKRA
jgi:transposase-like protein